MNLTRIDSVKTLLTEMLLGNLVPPGSMAEINVKQAIDQLDAFKVEVANEQPPAPPALTTDQLQEIGKSVQDLFTGMATRLGNIETATATLLTASGAMSDKMDGFEDALGVIVHNTTPADSTTTTQ
jgi:hypothetical protein